MGVTYFLLLSSLGLAIVAQAQDCSKPVEDNMSLKEDIQSFPNGTKVTFACNVGYVTAGGSGVITCTNGQWSPVRLKCERTNCGSAGEVENGNVNYPEGTEFGDRLTVTCKSGYILVGQPQLYCGVQGWQGRLPVCEVVTCLPPTPTNSTFSPIKENYNYAEVVLYTCQKDLTLSGSRSLLCSDDGTFKPAPPICIRVQCADPDIQDADWVGGSRPPHKFQATVTFKCRSGFTMTGASTLTCGIGNQWLPGLPTCEKIVTTPKPTTTTTTTSTTTTTIRPIVTKKPTADLVPTDPPGNNGNAKSIGLGVGLTVLIICVLTACGCYFCGVPAFIKRKRSRREVPKDGEEVALS